MSSSWSEGYFTDTGYTYGYYRDINPLSLSFNLLIRGYDFPEITNEMNHCELGFGQGVSIAHHATSLPGNYFGTDFNPQHAAHANSLLKAAGAKALLVDDSFEEFLNRSDLPKFDTISLHGIWTWVSRENHKVISQIARKMLRPGGILYLSYNCFPGWSPAYPLRQIFAMFDHYENTKFGATERVGEAIEFCQKMLDANPRYLQQVPSLTEKLKSLKEQDKNYLAHEYLNKEWNCMYFSDVATAMQEAKLEYLCTASPIDTVDSVNLRPEAIQFLQTIKNPILKEQSRDYFVSQQFRKDIYARGATRLTPIRQREKILTMSFVLLREASKISMKVTTPLGEAELQKEVYQAVINALSSKGFEPKTISQILELAPELHFNQVIQAISILISLNAVSPCVPNKPAVAEKNKCRRLNLHLLTSNIEGTYIDTLASPVIGGGVYVPRFSQLFLHFRVNGVSDADGLASSLWNFLKSQGQKVVKLGKQLDSDEENLKEIKEQAITFVNNELPILQALQVV